MAEQNEMWAIVELMGHGRTAGVIRTSDLGGLLRVDVPAGDEFRTEYYGAASIYSIKVVSEEIARAYAQPEREIAAYNEPIVPRALYEQALEQMRRKNGELERKVEALSHRLVSVDELANSKRLPPGEEIEQHDDEDQYTTRRW